MNQSPDQPRKKPTHTNFAALQNGETLSDNGEISFIEVAERSGQSLPPNLSSNMFPGISSLLHRNLCDTGQWRSVLFQKRRIANDENFGVVLNRQVRSDLDSSSSIGLRIEPLSRG